MNDLAIKLDELESSVAAPERRLVVQVMEYWRAAGGGARYPALAGFDPAAIGDKGRHCYLLDLGGDGDEPRLGRVGAALIADCGVDPTGGPASAVPDRTVLSESLKHVPLALERRAPVSLGGRFAHAGGRDVLFRTVILPLAGPDGAIAGLFGAANHRPVETG